MKGPEENALGRAAARRHGHKHRTDGTGLLQAEHAGSSSTRQPRVKHTRAVELDGPLVVREQPTVWERELLLPILLAAFQEAYSDGSKQAA